jgi:hypothetical protein
MRLSLAPVRVAQPERGDEANLRALYLCNGHAANQMYVPPSCMRHELLTIMAVVLSAIQDILLQLHLRECGLL